MSKKELKDILVLKHGEVCYGIVADLIKEIIPLPLLTKLPKQSEYLKGISDYRGNILPVLSMNGLTGTNKKEQTCVVLEGEYFLGLAVEETVEFLTESAQKLNYDEIEINRGILKISEVISTKVPIFILDIKEIVKNILV